MISKKLVIVSALSANMFEQEIDIRLIPLGFNDLQEKQIHTSYQEYISYIRHEPTNNILKKYFPNLIIANEQMYKFEKGDHILLCSLKQRPAKGTTDIQVTEQDLALALLIPFER